MSIKNSVSEVEDYWDYTSPGQVVITGHVPEASNLKNP